MALESIVVDTTTTANREMYIIIAIKFIQTIMTITAKAVITAIIAITAVNTFTANLFITATIAITINIEKRKDGAATTVIMGIADIEPFLPL